jgi:ACS family D-galactonate transporter-like MFS transporter
MNTTVGNGVASPPNGRFRVLAFLFAMVVINYLDRSNLSVAAPDLSRDLHLDTFRQGLIFSAFGWAYAGMQIPGGWLVDRVGPRGLFALICALWSLATILQGFAGSFLLLFSLRLLLGAFEAPAYPLCNRLVTAWFPDRERAGAIGCYTSGQYIGLAFLTPVLALAQAKFGWPAVFILTGILGLAWAVLWLANYRDPAAIPGNTPPAPAEKIQWNDFKKILSVRKLWGIYFGQFALTSTMWFFLTWFPTYLVKYRGLDFIQAGFLASLPFLAAFCGILASGFVSDFLLRRGFSPTAARKAPVITGLLLSTFIVGANYVDQPGLIILFMSIAFFGNGFGSITWVLVSSMAPQRLMGLTGGVFNFFGNLSAVTVPVAVGWLARAGRFEPALLFVGCLALAGALSYIFVVGRVERIQLENEPGDC